MKRFFKGLILFIVILFILIQFYPRPEKNINPSVSANDISVTNTPPLAVLNVLKSSCYDCHSNNTVYPWYSAMQPIAWWMGDHIKEGKKELNFSEFGTYRLRKKYKKLDEIIKEVKEGEMPLKSYTIIHVSSKLDDSEKEVLLTWANKEMESMKIKYPADSLKIK